MANAKLFVSNLDFELKPEDIRGIFAEFGTVLTLTLVTDRETNKSRGYCFIEMASTEEATKAIEALNSKVFNGRPISVAEDRGKKSGGGASPRGEKEGGGQDVFVPLQPMQRVLFFRRKKRLDPFLANPDMRIDFRDVRTLSRFLSERGRILPRRLTGLSAYNQRQVSRAIKRAQHLGLISFSGL